MNIKNCELKIVQADITELKADAIVNAANGKLTMNTGVAGQIKKKGGTVVEDEVLAKSPVKAGEAVYTKAGNLPVRYVIHAVIMQEGAEPDEITIRRSCANALKLAGELNLESIVLPALGCGSGGFSYVACAKIMAQEVFSYLRDNDTSSLRKIMFCLYTVEAYNIFNKNVFSYLDYILRKVQEGPFVTVDAIIEVDDGIVLIERSNPPFGWAFPGGFVDYGESLEEAVIREVKEETNMDLDGLQQFHTYSHPSRDPRFHTVATVYIARGKGEPKSGSDAANLKIVKINELKNFNLAFDHKNIIEDYLIFKKGK